MYTGIKTYELRYQGGNTYLCGWIVVRTVGMYVHAQHIIFLDNCSYCRYVCTVQYKQHSIFSDNCLEIKCLSERPFMTVFLFEIKKKIR